MKSKKRIRPFKKVCAAVLAAVLLSGGFGTSGALPEAGCAGFFPEFTETAQAATADGKIVTYDTDTFQDIPYISDMGNVTIYINDPEAFALEKAEMTTSVSGVSMEENIVTGTSSASCALVWSDWSNRSVVSGTNYSVWDVSTEVSATNPITLTWEDAAETQYGESLDVKLVITELNFSYAGRRPNAKTNNGYYGLKNVNGSTVDFIPRTDMEFMKTNAYGRLTFQSYACAYEDDTTVLDTIGGLTFGTDMDYHLEFYDSGGNQVSGTYLMYMQDVDVQDNIAYYTALAGNGWVVADGMDIDNTRWWDPESDYIESIKFPTSTTEIYAIDKTDDYDTSMIQYSSKVLRRISSFWSSENQIEAAGDAYAFTHQTLIAAVQAAVCSGRTLTWTGSRCSSVLFRSYSPETGTITLTKAADNDQNIETPDLSGALYAVHQESEDGPIIGFFVTDSDGTGHVASVSETSGTVAYTADDTGTILYYTAIDDQTEMEVNVGQYYVEELISPYGYALDTSTHRIEVSGGENEGVESTDTVDYQQITLTKKSLNADGSEDASDSTAYTYTVVISGLEPGQEIRYTVNGGTTKSRTAGTNGSVTIPSNFIALQNGQSAVFEIPVGASYKITESSNEKIASYTVTDANAGSGGTIVSASGANNVSQKSLTTATETADSGEDVTITFTNTAQPEVEKPSVDVILTKVSVDADGHTDESDTNAYNYTIKLGGLSRGDTYSYVDRTGETTSVTVTDTGTSSASISLSLLPDEAVTLTLPEGAVYQITETANAKIPSYKVTDANTDSGGTIVSASGQADGSATALSTATETAEEGEEVTVTFKNRSEMTLAAIGSLSFDANGGTYSDGTDLKTLMYDGDADGYEESGYTARSTNYTRNKADSDAYAVPEREGYTFLGWATAADADTAYYTADYTKNSNLADIESLFPELINACTDSEVCYYLFVPNTGLSDSYTWYYAGDYFKRSTGSSGLTVYDDLMQSLGAVSGSSLTALLTCSSEDDYYCSVTGERDMLYYYTSYNNGEYILPGGTYYCAYETDSGEVTTANITLVQSDNEDYFSIFAQTLYAVWEKTPGYLSLQKTADGTQNFTPDMDGALYAVHQDDVGGEIAGYFITDADGAGYAASSDSADADSSLKLSVSYDDTTFYATSETVLKLEPGTYYVEELAAPDMYEAEDIGEVTVTEDDTEADPVIASYDDGDGEHSNYLKVSLTKVSRNTDGSLNSSDSSHYSYTITIGNLESGEKITYVVCSDGDELTKTATAGTNGKAAIVRSISPGDEIYFLLPVGAQYTITEKSTNKIASYTVEDGNADSGGTIISASGANETANTALSTETETADDGEDVTVTFTNTTVERVQVCLFKQSVDRQGNEDTDDTTAYDIYVCFTGALSGEDITYESDTNEDNSGSIHVASKIGSTTVSIQSGETITFSNVPIGAEYYFREESNDRIASYEITNAGSSGTVEGDASGSNEESGLSLTTALQTAESGEETTVAYINKEEEKTAGVRVLKVDADGEPLAGAVFDLYDAEDELLAEGLETGEDGYTEIVEELAAGDYYFVETDAPDGYAVTDGNPIDFTITEDDIGTTVTVTVTDNTLQILPNAGGTGIWVILLMSIGTACAAVLILRGRRTGIAPV